MRSITLGIMMMVSIAVVGWLGTTYFSRSAQEANLSANQTVRLN